MVTVRDKDGLHPDMQPYLARFEKECDAAGLDVLIHCTFRPHREQAILFRQGRSLWEIVARADDLRTTYGRPDLADILMGVGPQMGKRRLTNAAPGQSMHGYRLAWDGCPIFHGKLIYDDETNRIPNDIEDRLWKQYGVCALAAGLEWAGNWKRMREMPHCQKPGVIWQNLIKEKTYG